MIEYSSYKTFLNDEFERRVKLNSRYSKRAFANYLKISPGALTDIMSGKRPLSHKNALKIAESLGLTKTESNHLMSLVNPETSKNIKKRFTEKKLSKDIFKIISNWYCFGILNLADCINFRWNYAWISKKLGISISQAKDAIERMVRVGLIKETKNGLKASEEFVITSEDIPSRAGKDYHQDILSLAKNALETKNLEDREISGITFAIDPKHVEQIKKDIDEFQDQMVEKYCKGKRSSVYHLEVAFFELTQERTK